MPSLDFSGSIPDILQLKKTDFRRIFKDCLVDLTQLNKREVLIELVFVGDEQSCAINRDYSGNDYPTDVLSFDYNQEQFSHIPPDLQAVGLIAIDIDQLVRQAQGYSSTPKDEAVLLFVHGLLHIAGYDHQTAIQQASFLARQSDMIKRNGFKNRDFSWSH